MNRIDAEASQSLKGNKNNGTNKGLLLFAKRLAMVIFRVPHHF